MRCAEYLERLTASAEVETVLGSVPASSDTVESEGRQMEQCLLHYIEKKKKKHKIPLLKQANQGPAIRLPGSSTVPYICLRRRF